MKEQYEFRVWVFKNRFVETLPILVVVTFVVEIVVLPIHDIPCYK